MHILQIIGHLGGLGIQFLHILGHVGRDTVVISVSSSVVVGARLLIVEETSMVLDIVDDHVDVDMVSVDDIVDEVAVDDIVDEVPVDDIVEEVPVVYVDVDGVVKVDVDDIVEEVPVVYVDVDGVVKVDVDGVEMVDEGDGFGGVVNVVLLPPIGVVVAGSIVV